MCICCRCGRRWGDALGCDKTPATLHGKTLTATASSGRADRCLNSEAFHAQADALPGYVIPMQTVPPELVGGNSRIAYPGRCCTGSADVGPRHGVGAACHWCVGRHLAVQPPGASCRSFGRSRTCKLHNLERALDVVWSSCHKAWAPAIAFGLVQCQLATS